VENIEIDLYCIICFMGYYWSKRLWRRPRIKQRTMKHRPDNTQQTTHRRGRTVRLQEQRKWRTEGRREVQGCRLPVELERRCRAARAPTWPFWATLKLQRIPTAKIYLARVTQTNASRRLKAVAVSARLAPSHASYRGPEGVQNSSGRQVVWCRRTATLEQVVCFTAVIWQSRPVQKTVEDVFVCQGLGYGA